MRHSPWIGDNMLRTASSLACNDLLFIPPYVIWGRHGEILDVCRLEHLFGHMDNGAKAYLLILFGFPWIVTNTLYVLIL